MAFDEKKSLVFFKIKPKGFLSFRSNILMSGSRTNHQLHRLHTYPRGIILKPCNVRRISFLRVDVLSIRIGMDTPVEPPCCSVRCGTVNAAIVVILVRCRELHVVVVTQAIPYNQICNALFHWLTQKVHTFNIKIRCILPFT